MPRNGRPKAVLELSDEEREQLQRWARRRKFAQGLATRSRIVLDCAAGFSNKEVAVRASLSANGGQVAGTLCRTAPRGTE